MCEITNAIRSLDWPVDCSTIEVSYQTKRLEQCLQLSERPFSDYEEPTKITMRPPCKTFGDIRGDRYHGPTQLRTDSVALRRRQLCGKAIDLDEERHAFLPHDQIAMTSSGCSHTCLDEGCPPSVPLSLDSNRIRSARRDAIRRGP